MFARNLYKLTHSIGVTFFVAALCLSSGRTATGAVRVYRMPAGLDVTDDESFVTVSGNNVTIHRPMSVPQWYRIYDTATGDHTYRWGEKSDDTTIDLVNSVEAGFDNVTTGDDLEISLLAMDRSDVPTIPCNWAIGAWDVDANDIAFDEEGYATFKFRYDRAKRSDLEDGDVDQVLIVVRYYDESRYEVTQTDGEDEEDETNHWIGTEHMQDLSGLYLVVYAYGGDANLDGTVSIADWLILQNHFNQAGTWFEGDFNGDGQVTVADYLIMQNNWGKDCSGGEGCGCGDPEELQDMLGWYADLLESQE